MLRRARVLFYVAAMLSLGVPVAADTCVEYPNSRIGYVQGYGNVCQNSGTGCTECTNGGGGSCVTNGDSCHIRNIVP